jgi:hypothetical protein
MAASISSVYTRPPALSQNSVQVKGGSCKRRKCPHGRRPNECRDCGGASICIHGRRRTLCHNCRPNSMCTHRQQCSGGAVCKPGMMTPRIVMASLPPPLGPSYDSNFERLLHATVPVQDVLLQAEIALAPYRAGVTSHQTTPQPAKHDGSWSPREHESSSDDSSFRDDSFKSQHDKSGAFPGPDSIQSQNISTTLEQLIEDDGSRSPREHESGSDGSSFWDDSFKSQHDKSGAFPGPDSIQSQNISTIADLYYSPPTTSPSVVTAFPTYGWADRSVHPVQVIRGPPSGAATMYVWSTTQWCPPRPGREREVDNIGCRHHLSMIASRRHHETTTASTRGVPAREVMQSRGDAPAA